MNSNKKEKGIILILLHQEVSKYNAVFKFARGLSDRGYRVIFVGDSVGNYYFYKYTINQGFEYKIIEKDRAFYEKIITKQAKIMEDRSKYGIIPKPGLKIRLNNEMEKQVADHLIEKAERWIEKEPPRLVILDQFCIYNSIPFFKKRIPIIGLNTNLASSFCLKFPPVFSSIVPSKKINLIGYVRNFSAWLKIYVKHMSPTIRNFFYLLLGFGFFRFGSAYSVLKDIKKYGGKIKWGEYGYRLQLPEIVLSPAEFDFPITVENSKRCYVGTCVNIKRKEGQFDWVKVDKKKTLIYCSVGSHPDYCKERMKLFRSVIEAVQRRPNLQLIINIPDKTEREAVKPLPGNVLVTGWVPQIEILSKTHIFITHGGLSSVKESIYAGVPMIAFPWGVDQPGNTARVVFHHLGLGGNIKKATPGCLGEFIDKILKDNSFHHSVKQMQQIFHEQENCKNGIEFIERFLSK